MDAIKPFLPAEDGMLPYYMVFLSVVSIGNSIQTYSTLQFTRRVYNGRFIRNPKLPVASASYNPDNDTRKLAVAPGSDPKAQDQVTPLAARLFGTWTLITAIVRLYAAYNLRYGPVYDLAICTYLVAFAHFSSELFYYKSMTFGAPQTGQFVFSTMALIWMPRVRDYYVTL